MKIFTVKECPERVWYSHAKEVAEFKTRAAALEWLDTHMKPHFHYYIDYVERIEVRG